MAEPFDHYHKWLGIPRKDQPPHHYRLLGIRLLEGDPDVIAAAADGRMAQVKQFETGKHSAESQRILNEIALARVCLLNRRKKATYDGQMRRRLNAAVSERLAAAAPVTRSWPVAAIVAAVAVSLIGLAALTLVPDDSASSAETPGTPTTPMENGAADDQLPPNHAGTKTAVAETPDPNPEPLPVTTEPADVPDGRSADAVDPHAPVPHAPDLADDRRRSLSDLINQPDSAVPADRTIQPDDTPADPGAEPARLPVPDEQSYRESEKKVREIFQREFAAAVTADKKKQLAATLFAKGQEMADDPTAGYVLMRTGCRLAAEARDLTATLEMVDKLREVYEIDALAVKARLLEQVAGSTGRSSSVFDRLVAETVMQLADEAIRSDDFVVAGRFFKVAAMAVRKSRDVTLKRRVAARKQEFERQRQRFAAAKKALDRLAEDPADGEANLTAGRYYCCYAGAWEKGLPMLARCSDTAFAELAREDIARPEDPEQRLAMADGWWQLAVRQSSLIESAMQARAAYWYRAGLPGLASLDKARAEKRLEIVAASATGSDSESRGNVQQGNVALASNRTMVSGTVRWADKMLDGKVAYVKEGYAWANCPSQWVITFERAYRLQEIRFLLWNEKGNREYGYRIEVSADGESFVPLVDRSVGKYAGWQQLPFSPRPVKAIKLIGLHGNVMNRFYVVEFEAYCIPPASR